MTTPVFRNGKWIEYPQPIFEDALWSSCHKLQAASFYATALSQGYSPTESASLAEIYVQKRIFPEIVYPKGIESKLQRIMGRVGTT